MKKIIGLSTGLKNGNCEILLKEAAMGAEELGIPMEIIRAQDFKITPCTGCWACQKAGRCVQDDDVNWVLEKTVLDDCGLIVSVPVYHLRANALYMAIGEKMNHLIGKTQGAILKKTRVGGVISVGGGMYDWTTFGLSSAITFVSHTRVIADQVQLNHIGEPGSAVLERNQEQMARVRQLGRNVARAMQMPIKEVKFVGEHKPAACPICHCDLLQVEVDLPRVSCPVCWVHGDIVVENGSTRVRWDEESFKYARLSELDDHGAYIMKEKAIEIPALALEETIKILAKYKAYGTIIKPDKPAVKK